MKLVSENYTLMIMDLVYCDVLTREEDILSLKYRFDRLDQLEI